MKHAMRPLYVLQLTPSQLANDGTMLCSERDWRSTYQLHGSGRAQSSSGLRVDDGHPSVGCLSCEETEQDNGGQTLGHCTYLRASSILRLLGSIRRSFGFCQISWLVELLLYMTRLASCPFTTIYERKGSVMMTKWERPPGVKIQ